MMENGRPKSNKKKRMYKKYKMEKKKEKEKNYKKGEKVVIIRTANSNKDNRVNCLLLTSA